MLMCNPVMTDDDIRREVLRALIKARFNDTPNQFAVAADKPPGQINDMLAKPPRKAFGARIARELENKLGLDRLFFEDINNKNRLTNYSLNDMSTYIPANQAPADYSLLNGDEKILLDGFRAAGPERREDMLDAARKSLKTNQAAA